MKWQKAVLRVVLGLIGLAALAFIGLMIFAWVIFPRETHNVRKYPALRLNWQDDLVWRFPANIPESVHVDGHLCPNLLDAERCV